MVDNDFHPKLSERIDLTIYSHKLAENAENLFVMCSGQDIGHAGIYVNSNTPSFLSSIAVKKEFYGQNVAANLLKELISICKNKKSSLLKLEVSKENKKAQKLYLKHEFKISQSDDNQHTMTLILND